MIYILTGSMSYRSIFDRIYVLPAFFLTGSISNRSIFYRIYILPPTGPFLTGSISYRYSTFQFNFFLLKLLRLTLHHSNSFSVRLWKPLWTWSPWCRALPTSRLSSCRQAQVEPNTILWKAAAALNTRAVDPHSFFADPDPAFLLNADLAFLLNADPDPA